MSLTWEQTHARNTDPITSHAAAAAVAGSQYKATMLARLGQAFRDNALNGGNGLTAAEAGHITGYDDYGTSKRVSDLLREGKIMDTGVTRIAPSGRQQRVLRWV